jgi:hypothetical protein
MKNFFDFLDQASKNPTLGMEFLTKTNTTRQLKLLFKKCKITDVPSEVDCEKIIAAKKDLMSNIDNIKRLAPVDRTKY